MLFTTASCRLPICTLFTIAACPFPRFLPSPLVHFYAFHHRRLPICFVLACFGDAVTSSGGGRVELQLSRQRMYQRWRSRWPVSLVILAKLASGALRAARRVITFPSHCQIHVSWDFLPRSFSPLTTCWTSCESTRKQRAQEEDRTPRHHWQDGAAKGRRCFQTL
jgi:hypothetical protein